MSEFLQGASVVLTALLVVTSWAHVLELPGKRRLERDEYLVVQRIYYPGFTIAGLAEPAALLVALWWAIHATVQNSTSGHVWVAVALLAAAHATYWVVIHPVNRTWLEQETTTGAARRFFDAGRAGRGDWRRRRDRWESGHALRAVLTLVALLLAVGATT